MKLSQKQVAALWIVEGGSPAKADEASAVVMGESGGDTKVGNYCCHGLWAFNVQVGVASMDCALNPVCATRKAISLSKNGTDWTPWEAWTNGSYRKFLGGGRITSKQQAAKEIAPLARSGNKEFVGLGLPGVPNPLEGFGPIPGIEDIPGVGDALGGADDLLQEGVESIPGIGDLAAFFRGLGELFLTPAGWLRLGKILGGAIFVLWGINTLIKQTTGVNPTRTAKKAAETAAVVATVK